MRKIGRPKTDLPRIICQASKFLLSLRQELWIVVAMEKKRIIKTLRVVCLVIAILAAILNFIQACRLVPLSSDLLLIVSILNVLAWIGLGYTTFVLKNDH